MTTQIDNLITILKGLGLSENAARVFLACLGAGESTIWEIAKKSGVKRPTCYVILEELTWKGFAASNNDGKRITYSVISPKQLAQREEIRHNKLLNSISEFQSIASKSKEKPTIRTFEGKEGIGQIFNMILETPKGSTSYVIGSNLLEGQYSEILEEFVKNKKKKGINSKNLFRDTPEDRAVMSGRKNENREIKYLPSEMFNPRTQTNIFGDTVAYIVHGEKEPFATVIESSALAEDEKERFELLWRIASN
ncbi:MAG: helix-turn-helix domain-containing protein [bacterium]